MTTGKEMTSSQGRDLTVSMISTDNLGLLVPCLRSISDNTHRISLEVYLVDNASTYPLLSEVHRAFPEVQIIRNKQRLGFSTNNNLVLARGTGRYLMLLNDDTLVLDNALDNLVEFMDRNPEAGAVGARLLNPDGSVQPYCARFPNPIIEAIYPSINWSYSLGKMDGAREVDSVCGAALLVRREVYESVGGLDTSFDPIYSEEVDWCYRIRNAGWKICALPSAQVIHYGSYTMNRAVPRKYELLLSHKAAFFRKHHGSREATTYKSVLRISTLAKLAWWSAAARLKPSSEAYQERRALHRHILDRITSF